MNTCWKFECYVGTLSELPLIISNILCLQKYFILYFIYLTFYVMLQVTPFTMAGPAIMAFYVNRFKSEIRFYFLLTSLKSRHCNFCKSLYVGLSQKHWKTSTPQKYWRLSRQACAGRVFFLRHHKFLSQPCCFGDKSISAENQKCVTSLTWRLIIVCHKNGSTRPRLCS